MQGEIVNEDELLLREQQLSMGPMHECEKATNWFGDEIMDEMMFTRMKKKQFKGSRDTWERLLLVSIKTSISNRKI